MAGIRHLIDFSSQSKNHAPIIFLSSISTVLNYLATHPNQPVPESILHDLSAPAQLGYGEFKYVSERLLEHFSTTSGIPTSILRTGQITGPVDSTAGCWSKHKWFPSLIASFEHLGVLPDSLGSMEIIDWIPVDRLAVIITEILDAMMLLPRDDEAAKEQVYNLVNLNVTTWSALLPTVQRLLPDAQIVSLKA